jgi:hypothetical protein
MPVETPAKNERVLSGGVPVVARGEEDEGRPTSSARWSV